MILRQPAKILHGLLFLILIVTLGSCATPMPPTGGPPDRTPPVIERSDPDNGTINFDGRVIRIAFSKFINRSSFLNALEVEPDLAINYDVSWRRQTARIEFEDELPENTTVIIRLGTELQDMRGNNLASPYRLALSTGDEIDEGTVRARIRLAEDGSADTGYRVFLYRQPFDLTERANYVASTDTAGVVEFTYLAEDTYKALWVDDLNRNRIWESGRERAQPFHDSTFTLAKGGEVDLGTIFVDRPDTTAPELRGVGLLTEERLRLRFSEAVDWHDDSVVHIADSLGNPFTDAWPLFALPDDPQVVIAQSLDPLPAGQQFTLTLDGFEDLSGNLPRLYTEPFQGSAQEDTVRLRIIGDNTEPGLFNDEALVFGYNKLIDDDHVLDSLKVVAGNELIEGWPQADVERHRLTVSPDEVWESGLIWQFLVWNPDTERLRPYEPVIWQRNELGSIEVTIEDVVSLDEPDAEGRAGSDPEESANGEGRAGSDPEESSNGEGRAGSDPEESSNGEGRAVSDPEESANGMEQQPLQPLTTVPDLREYQLILFDDQGKIHLDSSFVQSIEVDRLPPLNYHVIVYRDDNGNGRWDPGRVTPFEAPEPYFVRRNVPVQQGFASELSVAFD